MPLVRRKGLCDRVNKLFRSYFRGYMIIFNLALLIIAPATIQACEGGYSPGFEPFYNAPLAPVQTCKALESNYGRIREFICNSDLKIHFQTDEKLGRLHLLEKSGESVVSIDTEIMPLAWSAYVSDLNRDAIDDVMVAFPTMGNGLWSEGCRVVFMLSSETDRTVHIMNTMEFGPEDIIAYYGDNRYQIVNTNFIYGEEGLDGKIHNYWVHHFFQADGQRIRRLSEIEPRWIMYSGQPNHQPTLQLTNEQKSRLWENKADDIFHDKYVATE